MVNLLRSLVSRCVVPIALVIAAVAIAVPFAAYME
jgi:hypothetical protein